MNSKSMYENLSLCVYIGNTSSITDQILINYCSQFGQIISCSIGNCPDSKRIFCDYRLIEFASKQQLENFLRISSHKIGSIILDVKYYEDFLINSEQILNLDRKLYIGPILHSNNLNTLIQFYKLIDPNLHYSLSEDKDQTYLLIEFTNRQYIRTIIQQKTIPKTFDNQLFTLQIPIHPKESILTDKSHCQLYINGLNEQITENILMDYFNKRAAVVACHRLSTNPKSALIEFEHEKVVQKILEIPIIHLYGTTLRLSKLPDAALPTPTKQNTQVYTNHEIDQLLETAVTQNHTEVSQPTATPSPDISECGWTSPPRAIIVTPNPIVPPERISSKPTTTTMNMNSHLIHETRIIDNDTKPMRNVTNNMLKFVEQFQNEIDQIKDEYMIKFTKDRTYVDHEINRLINEERRTFSKFERYFNEHKRRSSKSSEKYK